MLIEAWCLRSGSATYLSIHGEVGGWTVSDQILAQVHGVKVPEDQVTVEWKRAQQERVKRKRARIAADRQAAGLVLGSAAPSVSERLPEARGSAGRADQQAQHGQQNHQRYPPDDDE